MHTMIITSNNKETIMKLFNFTVVSLFLINSKDYYQLLNKIFRNSHNINENKIFLNITKKL